jgi:hypothetical protein
MTKTESFVMTTLSFAIPLIAFLLAACAGD